FVDQFLIRKKIREASFSPEIRKKIIDNEKLVFPRLADVLAEIERTKIQFSQGKLNGSHDLTVRLGVEKGPKEWTFSLKQSEIEEAFSYIWDRNCRNAIAATLGADDAKKVDYVILSGGTCSLGFHEKYL